MYARGNTYFEKKEMLSPVNKNPFPVQVLFTIGYRLLLDFVYVALIAPTDRWANFTMSMIPLRYLTSLLVVVVISPWIVALLQYRSPSSILLSFLNYLYFIPLTSYCGCYGVDTNFFLVGIVYWVLMLVLQRKIPTLSIKPLSAKGISRSMTLLTAGAVCFVMAVSGKYTGFRFTLDFIHVYEIRAEAATYQLSAPASYLLGMMPIILAVLLAYWIQRKQWFIAAVLVVIFLFLFSIAANKSTFLFLILLLGSHLFYRDWMLRWMPGLLGLACVVPFIEHALGGIWFLSLLFRRMMYVPAQLAEKYAIFFSKYPVALFQNGIMGKFSFDDFYSTNLARVMGEFMSNYDTNENSGLLADMYANLPAMLGLLFMPLILILCFRLLDLAASSCDYKTLMPFCIYFAMSFINTSWSTVLLTHGFLAACLMLYFVPKEEKTLL